MQMLWQLTTYALSCQDLVIMCTESQACRTPSIEVIGYCHSTSSPLGLSHAPVLIERGRPRNTGLVYALCPVNIVGTAVRIDGSESRGTSAWVVRSEVLDDIVLDQWARGPPVD